MEDQNPLSALIEQLTKLPSIGQKSAQRLAFFFLSLSKAEVQQFAKTLSDTRENIKYCQTCFNISFAHQCMLCKSPLRNPKLLCVVAEPKDIFAIERTQEFKGLYHVLGGLISPIDGVKPDMLRISELISRVRNDQFSEVILALNPTVEGETTSLYLSSCLKEYPISITKLAYGLPVGADIDYADDMTLQKALSGRRVFE
jgi:recombination protein RecR